jgi:uncharacterized protein (DUF2252 family)
VKQRDQWPPPEQRNGVLLARKRSKMAASVHAFVRGSTAHFYEWLRESRTPPPDGPPVWICGDCHVGNLGPLEDSQGDVAIQVRDLDQSVPANPSLDLLRLGLSLAMVARGARLPGVSAAAVAEELIGGYCEGLIGSSETTPSRKPPKSLRCVLREAEGRTWSEFLTENLKNTHPTIPLGSHFWPLTREEREAVARVFEGARIKQLITNLYCRDDDATIQVVDAAYWVKGCSSLGNLRLAALIKVSGESLKKGRLSLIDMKEAVKAHAPHPLGATIPDDHAERVVEGARRVSPYLGDRMAAVHLFDKPLFVRELLPQDLKIDVEQFSEKEARKVSRYLAAVVGRAHGRQLGEPERLKWNAELRRSERKALRAPSWLWANIVALVARHEAAYLEHCRRYMLCRDNGSSDALTATEHGDHVFTTQSDPLGSESGV